MKYAKWTTVVLVTVALCVFLFNTVSKLLSVSPEAAIFIIGFIVFPVVGFIYDCILLSKINK